MENVLKGSPIPTTIAVYYFTWAHLGWRFRWTAAVGFLEGRGRRILWLRKDAGVLRTVCDGWDGCTVSVQSGAHLHYRPDPQKALNYALIDLGLTRGEGTVNEVSFASEVEPWECKTQR